MIAIFLVGTFAIPIAQFPMRALQEQMKSAYRMQLQRFADLAYAKFKEDLYKNEISWEILSSPKEKKAVILDNWIDISLSPIGTNKFKRSITLYSIGKKDKQGQEWRLVTFEVKFNPTKNQGRKILKKDENKDGNDVQFTYQVLIQKVNQAVSIPTQEIPVNIIDAG